MPLMWSSPSVNDFELASLHERSSQEDDHSRSFLPAQLWRRRVFRKSPTSFASCPPIRRIQYSLLSDVDDMDIHNHESVLGHSSRSSKFRRLVWTIVVALPSLVVVVILLVATFFPSYSHPPHHYNDLRERAARSKQHGRINPDNEKIFIASSIYDKQGRLTSGAWGQNVLGLIDLLGPQNVFLSILEDDPDPLAKASLQDFAEQVKCNSSIVAKHVDRAVLPHVKLPNGKSKLKRIEFLAHVRNLALAPLEDPTSAASTVRFDKLLYINDVVFDPVDAANLIFSTNVDKSGKAQYQAACAADFINPFKYYDTFATRDHEGNQLGVPIYPWFSGAGRAESRRDVLDQKDAVRVRSCWGGMAVFNARWFQPDGFHVEFGVADLQADHNISASSPALPGLSDGFPQRNIAATTPVSRSEPSPPLRFRATSDLFWDASECCLIHADIEAASNDRLSTTTGIFLNPYIRVAYSSRTLALLHLGRRFERLFAPFQRMIGSSLGLPNGNPRKNQEVGAKYEDLVWEYDDPEWTKTSNMSGSYKNVTRVALPGGFCGGRQLLVLGEGDAMREWSNKAVTIPDFKRWSR